VVNRPIEPAAPRREWLGGLAIVSGLAFLALALVVAGGPLPIDLAAADALRPLQAGLAGQIIDSVNVLGQPATWDSLVVLTGIALWLSGRRLEAVVLVGGVIAADLGATAVKLVVGRHRPPGIVVADVITQASYPSGHMTRAVVTGGLLAATVRSPGWRATAAIAAVAFATLMGIARVAVGEHWLTDVVGAALYGLAAVAAIVLVGGLIAGRSRARAHGSSPAAPRTPDTDPSQPSP
jgi:undecaprenyl-diphosphatase